MLKICILALVATLFFQKAIAKKYCYTPDNCRFYQTDKIGPYYKFSYFKLTKVHDSMLATNDFTGAMFNYFVRINLSNKNFKKTHWQSFEVRKDVKDANFEESYMRGFIAKQITFNNVNFKKADLWGSIFTGAHFKNVKFNKAVLRYVDLGFASFKDTDISGADFRDANLLGAVFSNVTFDAKTKFPDGFDKKRLNKKSLK